MPTVIDTSTFASATAAFNGRRIDRNQDGTLWVAQTATSTNTEFWYSKDNGGSWTFSGTGSDVAGATNVSLFIDLDDYAHLAWKQSGTGGGRTSGYIYYMRGTPNVGRTAWTWSAAVNVQNGSSVTAFDFPDVVACRTPGASTWDAFVVYGEAQSLPANRALYTRIRIAVDGTPTTAADGLTLFVAGSAIGILGGSYAVNAHTYPSIDFNHTGDGKTVQGATPHLYVGWTAGAAGSGKGVRFRKAVYSGGTWTWNAEREIDNDRYASTTPYQWQVLHFDGTRAVIAGFLRNAAGTSVATVMYDRDAADTTTTARTPNTDILGSGSATYDSAGNVYLFGRDGSGASGTRNLNSRKWTRSGATLGAITTFDTTGPDAPYISARRGHTPGSSIDWVWTDGTSSPYSVTFDRISLNTAPNAPTLTAPVAATTIDRTATQRFTWTFSDPDAGDTQSAFDLRYRIVGAGSWTDVPVTSTSAFHDFTAATFTAGDWEWQVRTYDAAGVVGPYSASEFFTAATPPATPSITAPINNSTISAMTALATWSAPSQEAYQLRTVADVGGSPDTGTIYTDTGTVIDSAARSRSLSFPTNSRAEHVQLRVRVAGLWSTWASVKVNVSYTPPATPTVVAVASSSTASIAVTLASPAPSGGQPAVASYDLYRREGASGDGIRIGTGLAAGVFTDRSPASGVAYQYQAVAIGDNDTSTTSAWTA